MSAESIRKIRKNFILTAMLSFITVMVFTGGLINIANNLQLRNSMENVLDYIIDNKGDLPDQKPEEATEGTSLGENTTASARERGSSELLRSFAPEYRYTTRYFAVLYDRTGRVQEVKLSHIHSVDRESAVEAAERIRELRYSFGDFGGSYFFKKAAYMDGASIVVVLDALTLINVNRSIIRSTILICAAGLLITFAAVLSVSGRMIRPEIENARRQKMFITNASHELKTPLAIIRANTELEELMNGETEWTQSTLRQVDRLNGLIQNLVMIARAQEAEEPGARKEFNASAVILDTVKPYESLARQDEKTLTTDIAPDIRVNADESRIRQLAAILIDNAFKYCDDHGAVDVLFSKNRIGRQVRLAVSNTYARGKDVDYTRFFERFYREDSAHSADGGKDGFGIGLSIAENICTQYKGSIRVSWKDDIITFTCLLSI
ncbi:MAG: GHKL domain-containing protein [Lachnospiraceae bacterium]|nr:GHKL domain-containing protein [Sarcina sp.]MBQ6589975.1 GHKL domain-containing protein [Lachnospiraceae bacterium]